MTEADPMGYFTSDDPLSTYSMITSPSRTPVKCFVTRDGGHVDLSFGTNGRVALTIDAAMLDPIMAAPAKVRTVAEARAVHPVDEDDD
ncbi:hypothetical protein [Allonocardiopsis opalescens]|uniref:Uncharacterized protein n=1 Tax=Allonocardiopsis opalescens TaxID=1144618 RepID=A0A2T0QE84_9ACTN|nr:hypothetical protein [Allonocardiopsis opalescens]PRY02202.1 hypothetical protein CLV72_101803 [Allonocardiopsis opalescens]